MWKWVCLLVAQRKGEGIPSEKTDWKKLKRINEEWDRQEQTLTVLWRWGVWTWYRRSKASKWLWTREWLGKITRGEISMKKHSFNLSNTLLPKIAQWENTELQRKRLLHFLLKTYQGWQAWLFIWACFAFHYDQVLMYSPPKQCKV